MDENTEKKTWLKRLQYDSWEPEILISGIVIYGLFKIFPYLDEFQLYLENYASDFFRGSVDDNIIALIKVSLVWLIFGFIAHLFLRSFWVAYIGLSYVYKNDIDYKRLKYDKIYFRKLKNQKSITTNIEKLERICSTIFSISILFFMNFLGLIFCIAVIGFGVYLWLQVFPDKSDFSVFNYILQVVLILSVIDYLSSGLLKRIPYFKKIYYPIYKIVSVLTLSPLYRKIYYTFITNHSKWKVFLFLTLFTGITFLAVITMRTGLGNGIQLRPMAYADYVMSPQFYLDEAKDKNSKSFWIPSQKISSQTLEVFVVHTPAFEETNIKPLCDFDKKVNNDSLDINAIRINCLKEFYELRLDDQRVNSDAFYTKSYQTKQDGLKYFIPIDSLNSGRHSLSLYYNFYNDEKDTIYKRLKAKTDFYKETSIQ
ncbi:MAG: hypothetical protein GVY05_05090 [Bacteroidetes bacterium]|jgi:hypothetical protein|nr:hypothetical protein [Bacteroidota bacterium]